MTPAWILLLLLVYVTFGKYVYVGQRKSWGEAQEYCRANYTDLAPISNEYDANLLSFPFEDLILQKLGFIWIGLTEDPGNETRWLWSGGGEVKKTFWRHGEPNDYKGREEDRGAISRDLTWFDVPNSSRLTFFCYKVHAVRERKTWEEALAHCRTHHRDLASVASETELMLMQKELGKKAEITEHVWIGLKFLAEDWLWVDWQPLEYEAWGPGGEPWCPTLNDDCAALQVERTSHSISGSTVADTVVKGWTVRSCDDKLHFVCY